jgi:hypothetical protein
MKISKYIKNKMHKLADLSYKASKLSQEIDNYFEENKYDIEELRSGDGISLEELEYGNDVTDQFCDWFENEKSKLEK